MGGTPPGPTGLTNSPVIDSGTSTSHETSLPGALAVLPSAAMYARDRRQLIAVFKRPYAP